MKQQLDSMCHEENWNSVDENRSQMDCCDSNCFNCVKVIEGPMPNLLFNFKEAQPDQSKIIIAKISSKFNSIQVDFLHKTVAPAPAKGCAMVGTRAIPINCEHKKRQEVKCLVGK